MTISMKAIESHVLDLIAKDVVAVLALPSNAVPIDPTSYTRTIWQIAQKIREQVESYDDDH